MTYLTYFRLLCGSSILVLLVAKLQVIVDGVRASTVPADYLVGTRSYGSLRSCRRQELAPDSAGHSRSVVMAVLADGQKFALSSISKSQTNKSVLYVKLTDSALRSLEEYLKNKVS